MGDIFLEHMLEEVRRCPLCYSFDSEKIISSQDNLFFCSSRYWSYSRCNYCGSVYLVKRPRLEYISYAYSYYFTHENKAKPFKRCVNKLIDLYLQSGILARIFRFLSFVIFPFCQFLDAKSRGLRYLPPGKVFDYGCGEGSFLRLCNNAGWVGSGSDLDGKAIKKAREKGVSVVEGGLDVLKGTPSCTFDLVTVSHVVEHVYDVDEVLGECCRILKPGGVLWLETPNANASGLSVFGEYWRGLEPPRHLFLFSKEALLFKLKKYGFCSIKLHFHFLSCFYVYLASERLRQGSRKNYTKLFLVGVHALARDIFGLFFNNKNTEFLTLSCRKKY